MSEAKKPQPQAKKTAKRARSTDPSSVVRLGELNELSRAERAALTPAQRARLFREAQRADPSSVVRGREARPSGRKPTRKAPDRRRKK